MRSQMPAETMPSRLANPGFIPDPKIELWPRRHASSMRARPSPSAWPVMNAAVATMLAPTSGSGDGRDIGPRGVVHDTVGPEREQGLDLVGRDHPDGADPAELADVAPRLL